MHDSDAGTREETTARSAVTVRFWASARAAAGRETVLVRPGSLAQVLDAVRAEFTDNKRLRDVMSMCSILVGDRPVTTEDPDAVDVPAGSSVELLPPFAGGR